MTWMLFWESLTQKRLNMSIFQNMLFVHLRTGLHLLTFSALSSMWPQCSTEALKTNIEDAENSKNYKCLVKLFLSHYFFMVARFWQCFYHPLFTLLKFQFLKYSGEFNFRSCLFFLCDIFMLNNVRLALLS